MLKKEEGYTLIEALIVLIVVGALFYFLAGLLDINVLGNKAKNASLQSSITRIVLSTDGFYSAYNRVPNEEEFLESITSRSAALKNTCKVVGFERYECLFKLVGRELPVSCDSSFWRFDKEDTKECYMRYYAGPSLSSNRFGETGNYRIYARTFGKEKEFYVFDSKFSGKLYRCPSTLNDFDTLKECDAL